MIAAIRRKVDHFFGRGEASIFVPVMDGALKANEVLDGLDPVLRLAGIDNLVMCDGSLLASSGARLVRIADGEAEPLATFDAAISALAVAPDGRLAVGLSSGRVLILPVPDADPLATLDVACPTALTFLADGRLAIASGSAVNGPDHWARDLMTHGASGQVLAWTVGASQATVLASGLAWPGGVVEESGGSLIVSESWAHRLIRIDPAKPAATPVETRRRRLPGYPGRIVPATGGGYWLAVFAPRNQLVEFTLKEKEYRERMIASVEERFWIAPCLRSGSDFREALQGGGVKQMGVLKPWAPSLSYGLVIRLDADLRSVSSLHSRANGHVHGITSVATGDLNGQSHLWVGARGDGLVVTLAEAEA